MFVIGSLLGLGRLQGDLATAALCVVSARFVHGLFDIYWTGGTTPLPWIVAGMALAPLSSRLRVDPATAATRGAVGLRAADVAVVFPEASRRGGVERVTWDLMAT